MNSALWAALVVVAALWPARLAGPLDGVPLDTPFEALTLGLVGVALLLFEPRLLRRWSFRVAVLALLAWKAATGALLTQDGWCLRFTTPQPVFRDMGLVPHTWDIRADWRSPDPVCSAVMTRSYPALDRFPVWFFNLPPADPKETPLETDRPPLATLKLHLDGYLATRDPGILRIELGDDMRANARVDDATVSVRDLAAGINLGGGVHRVAIEADLSGDRWRLAPTWNGADPWQTGKATLSPPTALDWWMRPWGGVVPAVLIGWLVVMSIAGVASATTVPVAAYAFAMSVVALGLAAIGRPSFVRAFPLLLASAVLLPVPRRMRNLAGMRWLIVIPFLALIAAIGLPQVGSITLYSGGDDWWMFQRYAYRIVMQGYWLEGGTPTFWFQPLYRWIAGALHVIFGDSSVGEVFWDGACLLTGACFAFHIARLVAGFRWGIAAAVVTLAVYTVGPGWYLIGRGLSEISSAGFIYGAALLALRSRGGSRMAALGAGVLATLGFYTRLNNLPMVLAVAAFAWPVRQQARDLWRPLVVWSRGSHKVVAGVLGTIVVGVCLLAARTWYYTGSLNILQGTQAGALSVWQPTDEGEGVISHILGSVLMVLTMNDPPRFDVRAVPVVAGVAIAILSVLNVRAFGRLPLNAVALCIAAISGALVARGTAYPGRFTIHLIPVTVALSVCAAFVLLRFSKHRSS